jgi:hypothetical protein
LQIKTKIVSCHTADSKPVKQKVNGTVMLPPLAFPDPLLHHIKVAGSSQSTSLAPGGRSWQKLVFKGQKSNSCS